MHQVCSRWFIAPLIVKTRCQASCEFIDVKTGAFLNIYKSGDGSHMPMAVAACVTLMGAGGL